MQRLGAVKAPLAERILFHDIQHEKCGDSNAVWRQFVHCPAPICGADRRDPLGLKLRQVIRGEHAALFSGNLKNGVSDRTFVKGLSAVLSDQA